MISWSTSDVAGVNFGDSHITVARMRGNKSGPLEVTHAGWGDYDPSAPEKEIATALRALWRKARLPTTAVVASLRSSALVVRYFKYPSMPEAELWSALQLQAEECLQLSRDELVVDCHINKGQVLGNEKRLAGEMIEGVLAAAPTKDVDRALSVLHMAGLDPIILDVRAMAVANLYAVLTAKREEPTICVVNLSPHSADVIVLSKSGGMYPHTVFCRASTWAESPEFLCENIRDVMKYSEFKLDWDPVHRVYLTGDMSTQGAASPSFNSEFMAKIQTGMKLPVEVWDPLKHLVLKAKRVKELIESHPADAARLAPSLGLALRRG